MHICNKFVTRDGLGPSTYCLEGSRSIQLSYRINVPGAGIGPALLWGTGF